MSEHSHDPTLIPPTVTFLGPPKRDDELGRLGQYRILKQLGRGGMGVVYQAQDTELNRLAALKVMHPDYAANEEARSRFKREAQAAAALKHEHIVTIYQVDVENNVPFLAMEFLAGKSLDEWLRPDRRATVGETLLIGRQIAKGLAVAHAAGLIHRDIKPANLWLEAPRGRVKILDFGLARRVSGEMTGLTQDGSILGTPAYMAPEQARGDAVDHRCDLFSFGCVLYRMLTGRLPFQGSTTYAVLTAIASETPTPVSKLRPEVPQRLSQLIERLLAKKPEDRPPSAQVVLEELLAIEKESKQPVQSSLLTPVRRTNPWPWVALGGGAVVVLGALLIAFGGFFSSAPEMEKEETEPVTPKEVETVPPKPAPVDLMALVDVEDGRVWGRLRRPAPGKLQAMAGEAPIFAFVLPWEPPARYRLKMKVTRLRDGVLIIGLSSGGHPFAVQLDTKREGEPPKTGLASVDDQRLDQRDDGFVGVALPPLTPCDVVLTVDGRIVRCEVNEEEIFQWEGDPSRLGRRMREGSKMPEKRRADVEILRTTPLTLSGSGPFLFEEITLEPLDDDPGKPWSASD